MKNALWVRLALAAACVVLLAVATAGCGSSSGSSSTSANTTSTQGSETSEAGSADYVAAAEETVAPLVGHPTPFSVAEKLKEVPKGATVDVMDCGLPYCALLYELLEQPAEMLGIHLERIKTGLEAGTVGPAFDSVIAKQPDGVIALAQDIHLWSKQLKELQEDEIPVITQAVADAEEFGVKYPRGTERQNDYFGEMIANYIVAHMDPEADAVVYEVPELSFTTEVAEAFTKAMEAACPKCSARVGKIPAASVGTKSSNEIVSDLQTHPETTVAVFTNPEMSVGLPSALQAAGIEIETLSNGPIPGNLQQIKEGKETAGLASDVVIQAWTLLDQTVREIVGQEIEPPESKGFNVLQFLTEEDITFNPEQGWTGYPDYAERFAKLWGVEPPK